jgi:RNA polymerase sigma-70 factor, ECF subfamily
MRANGDWLMPTEGEESAGAAWGRLIEAVASRRDRAAFVRLFEHFAPRVKTFMLRSGAGEATAEEIAQETMLSLWRRADSFVSGSTGPAAWIFTIARNLHIDALRREKRGSVGDIDDVAVEAQIDELFTPESQVAAVQLEGYVHKAMAQLSNEQLRLIESLFFEDRAHAEISAMPSNRCPPSSAASAERGIELRAKSPPPPSKAAALKAAKIPGSLVPEDSLPMIGANFSISRSTRAIRP